MYRNKLVLPGLGFGMSACLCVFTLIAGLSLSGCSGSAPASVAVTASASTVDGADTVTLTAAIANDRNSGGVTWSASGGGTLSNTTTTSATYTAPAATSSSQSVTITATSVADTSKTGTATIAIPAMPSVTSTGTSLTGAVGSAYSIVLTGSGGIAPYTWSLGSGATLPTCLTLKSTGVITTASGTAPTASCAGTYSNLTFTVTDSGTPTPLTVTSSALSITIAAAPALAFTGTVPATGTFGAAYNGSAAATGGAGTLTYSLASGALPGGLSLDSATGAVSGTPTSAGVGTFNFTIAAADAYGDSSSQGYSIVVSYPQVTVTTATTLPAGYGNAAYSQTLAASGGSGTGYTWTVTSGASSLTALNLTLSSAGLLSGTAPAAGGSASFGVQVTDSASNTASVTLALTIKAGVTISTGTALPAGYGITGYSQTLSASGGSGTGYTWTVTTGATSLTALNLTLSSAGLLSGTPPVAGGSASFGVQVTDSSSNTASATFSLTIDTGVSVTAPSLPPAYPGTAYASSAFAASGGSNAGFTWTMTAASGSSVPAGFSMGSATGIISAASPVNAGATNATYNVVITAADSLGNKGSANATITIEAAASIATGATLPSGTIHIAYSQQLAASGGSGTGYTWSTNGAGTTSLAGLNLTLSAGGLVSGTPATTGSATFAATVTDSESHASAPVTFSVTVYNALTITTTTLPAGDVGSSYSQTLAAGGGFGSGYTWTATASNLSTYGLSLSTAGVVSGTPSQAGTASFTAKVTDSNNNTATQALTITIYGALSLPAPNPSSLPSGYTGVAYTGSVSGSGGSSSVSIAVTSPLSPANGTLAAGISGATVNIAGTPTTAATESFTVQLTDTTTGDMTSQTYSIGISTPVAVSLPTPGSSIPGSATVSQSYASSISASGGVAPYTWSINGTTVTAGGLSLGNGLTAFSTGGSSMSISGTPSSTGTVTLTNVKVVDSLNSNATNTYTIAVNSAGQDITGSVSLSNNCNSSSVPQIALNLYTGSNTSGTPVQSTTTTDSNGDFTFSSVPSGSYTIVPTIAGVSSVFSPASLSITVSSSTVSGQYFAVSLGYTVSGTVAYSGSQAGQVYLALNDNNCGGNGGPGTSITESTLTSGGAFTIRGVPPGSYTLQAWMDPLGQGAQNVNDPTGSTSGLTVSSADLTGQSVALTDPAYATPDTNPQIQVAPNAGGAMIFFQPPVNGNQVEEANQYTVEWSTSPNFTSGPGSAFANVSGSHTFAAIGDGTTVWILNNTVTGANTFTSGTTYYFQARAFNTLAATPSPSGWSTYGGSTPTAVTIGAASCSGTCTTVSGAVTIPAGVTIAAGAPLYLGVFQNTDSGPPNIYAAEIASPVAGGSGNSYSISVPSGSGYVVVGILDQNNNGEIDAGDVTNARNNNSNGVTVSGSTMIGQNVTLPGVNSTATVTTQYYQTISQAGNSSSYQLTLEVDEANKLPVAVTLTSGPNLIHPVDMAICTTCGNLKYQYSATIPGGTPAVGDAYGFTVTYSDGSQETGAIVNGAVTGWNGGASVVDASDAATALAPSGTGSTGTTPTFTWTDSANAMGSNFAYSFYLSQGTGCTGNCTIWQIPGNNSSSNGFSSSITSIAWGVDPTGGGNTPSVGSLTSGDLYYWTIEAQDTNGNQVQTSTWYQP